MSVLTIVHNSHVGMLTSKWQLTILLFLVSSCSAQSTYYVTPTPDTTCPGEPCHTLSEYVADQFFNNLPMNTTMEFLPGNHTLEQTISVANLTWLTLHGDSPSLPKVTSRIECTWPAGFVFINITELNINGMAFVSCGNHSSAAVNIVSVQQSDISYCSFHYSMNADNYGGALYIQNSNVILTVDEFQNNFGGALYIEDSTLNLARSTFQNNSAYFGGALYAEDSILNLTGNRFQNNHAYIRSAGGALGVIGDSTLIITGNTFQYNSANFGGALYGEDSTLSLTGNTFQNNSAYVGGALGVVDSTLSITGNTFQNNSAYNLGGALSVYNSTLNLTGNTFQNNSAGRNGGALSVVHDSTLSITGNTFQNNSALFFYGGALCVEDSNINLTGNTFQYNSAGFNGGALAVGDSTLNLTGNIFQYNSADYHGGALEVYRSTLNLTGNTLQSNTADTSGGALSVRGDSTLSITGNILQNNSALSSGGALYIEDSTLNFSRNKFQKSYTAFGGTMHTSMSNVTFTDDCFTDSYADIGGAVFATDNSTVKMYDTTVENNRAQYGGGMAAVDSQLEFLKSTLFENNRATYGGGLYVHNTGFNGNAIFTKNSVTEGGGGIYATGSTFLFTDNTMIINNLALNGGGLLLAVDSELIIQSGIAIHFIGNSALSTGGAIKVEESNTLTYCIPSVTESSEFIRSDCFFQTQQEYPSRFSDFSDVINFLNVNHTMCFNNNTAIEAGADLYGGSVDSCTLRKFFRFGENYPAVNVSGYLFDAITSCEIKPAISSVPLHICTCRDGLTNCTGSYHPEPVYPGGTLEVPVIALGQRNGPTTAVIQVTDTSNIVLSSHEYSQHIDNSCNTLKYAIFSYAIGTAQEITLYAQGPCSPTHTNTLTIIVNIQHCPPGFQLLTNNPLCICAERLQRFTNTCLVDSTTVLRERNAEFWVGYDSDNESRGLILHPHCPFDYCTSQETYLAVDDSDKQCSYNRSGLLCGRCSENLSLALGSSRCLQCSNSYLSLLIAFAFAGIALVLLLLVLRLTVAAGTINGLVFYANIVAVNSGIFFQPQITSVQTGQTANVLSVFIAWLNLDVGIETCFYDGMDSYTKTWMQFLFPLYVWALVGVIIVGSHYSGRVARVFGRNPIAVLATLFLLSYAKLLRTIIAVLSYTSLEYPNNTQVAVWLYDGNIRYLSGKHIPLFIAAMVCLIFLFFPYTMLLIFSQWLQAKSHLKIFSCINSRYVKPFLDACHAPYMNKHRYWTGLMLLLRFVLFLISAVNAFGDPSVNLLAIVAIAILTLPAILGCRIYKTWILGLLETSFILNLTILAVATSYTRLSGGNQNAATVTSVGIAFATFSGIVIYHSVQQIKDTRLWRRLRQRHEYVRVPLTDVNTDSAPGDSPEHVYTPGSAPTQTVVDIRVLREPCMATD